MRQASFNPITGNLDIPRSSNVTLPDSLSYLPVNHNASNALDPCRLHQLLSARRLCLPDLSQAHHRRAPSASSSTAMKLDRTAIRARVSIRPTSTARFMRSLQPAFL